MPTHGNEDIMAQNGSFLIARCRVPAHGNESDEAHGKEVRGRAGRTLPCAGRRNTAKIGGAELVEIYRVLQTRTRQRVVGPSWQSVTVSWPEVHGKEQCGSQLSVHTAKPSRVGSIVRRRLPSSLSGGGATALSLPCARYLTHGKDVFAVPYFAVCVSPCVTHGEAVAVRFCPFAVCVRHTATFRSPVVIVEDL